MGTGRLEAFSDGVLAIIITIMVLELKVPEGNSMAVLLPLWPRFLSYLLSFIYLGIYWNNHHHLMFAVKAVDGKTLWANLHLLFWLSLVPFVTGWMGENHFTKNTVALYGVVLMMAAVSYTILSLSLIHNRKNNDLAAALGSDRKGKVSMALYALAIILAFFIPVVSLGLYAAVAVIWFIPDQRIESRLQKQEAIISEE